MGRWNGIGFSNSSSIGISETLGSAFVNSKKIGMEALVSMDNF